MPGFRERPATRPGTAERHTRHQGSHSEPRPPFPRACELKRITLVAAKAARDTRSMAFRIACSSIVRDKPFTLSSSHPSNHPEFNVVASHICHETRVPTRFRRVGIPQNPVNIQPRSIGGNHRNEGV